MYISSPYQGLITYDLSRHHFCQYNLEIHDLRLISVPHTFTIRPGRFEPTQRSTRNGCIEISERTHRIHRKHTPSAYFPSTQLFSRRNNTAFNHCALTRIKGVSSFVRRGYVRFQNGRPFLKQFPYLRKVQFLCMGCPQNLMPTVTIHAEKVKGGTSRRS
jgi:hypothetical protein